MPGISYQLYCSRKFPPLADTLSMLAATGFSDVEGFGGLYDDPAALRAMLDQNGLSMPTGHFGLDLVEGDPDRAISIARTLGVETVIVPHIGPDDRPSDAAGWTEFGKRLAKAGAPITAAGFGFGWHNHAFELEDLGGTTPLQAMLDAAPDMSLELDIGWVIRAGGDPIAWIDRYADRLVSVHIKDIASEGDAEDEDGWADVGHGVVDWGPIRDKLTAAGAIRLILEHDNPSDHARFAARSLETVKGW